MKKIVIVAVLGTFAVNLTFAAGSSCDAKAAEKKLAGAAKNSFLKKCNKDLALTAYGIQATEKKLAGAAKNSFLKNVKKTLPSNNLRA
ncbi:hypothetical protein [Candidatus Nitrotoga arctica]|uniref:PsiF repeat-containing protein n=1 Tax=Candidatus Nitrotoga arctica TaxID=453162 RepID=A0ABM8YZD3_9PROT|nr:hypothetical protein [Candidatus Nitrotoga arctica]CAG9932897.1 conserved exported protein of unknown function [Candidatus Nitrotoga arctica]